MVVAAYVVGGFLVASVYAVGMLRGRRDRYHRLGLPHPVHRGGHRHPDPDGRRRLARPVGLQQPADEVRRHRAGARDLSDVPETLLGHLNADGTVVGRHRDPWLRLVAVGSDRRHRDGGPGARHASPPTSGRPTARSTSSTWRGTSWSGSGTLLFLLAALVRGHLGLPRTCPRASCSCGSRRPLGVLAVITMEAGWVVSEVGRQPWIVYNLMKVEDAATGNTGVWITFVARRRCSTPRWASPLIYVLRGMSRRFRGAPRRRGRRRALRARPTTAETRSTMTRRCRCHEHRRRRRPVHRDPRLRRVRRRRLRRRVLGPRRRRHRPRRPAPGGDRPLDRARCGRPTTCG